MDVKGKEEGYNCKSNMNHIAHRLCMASGLSETIMDDNSLVWNVVYQVTGIFPLGFLGMESESIGTQGPGAPAPHAHPVLVALLGVGEHPGLLWAVKGPHLRRTNQP